MAEAIGLALAAIALVDPAYTRIQAIWGGFKAIGEFAVVFHRFCNRVRAQEMIFLQSIREYRDHIGKAGLETQWVNNTLRDTIQTQMAEITTVFEACYAIAYAYEDKDARVMEGDQDVSTSTALTTLRSNLAQSTRDKGKYAESKYTKALRELFAKRELKNGLRSQNPAKQGDTDSKEAVSQSDDIQGKAFTLATLITRRKNSQRNLSCRRAIAFAHHDQDRMEQLLKKLNDMNKELDRLVKHPDLSCESPLLRIRKNADPPTLWQDSVFIRDDLSSLQQALSVANGDEEGCSVKLAIQLEEDYGGVHNWVRGNRLDHKLKTRLMPSFFRLLVLSPAETSYYEFLLAGTISSSGQTEIEDGELPAKLRAMFTGPSTLKPGRKYQDIGDLVLDNQRMFNIRRVVDSNDSKWRSNHSLADIFEMDEIELTYSARVRLAARIALAHIHFANTNQGFVSRQPKNYRFFKRGSSPLSESWTQPWLDNGFGSAVLSASDKANIQSLEQVEAHRINPAKELGRLLYRIFSDSSINDDSAEEVDEACLSRMDEVFGFDIMLIVRACFCNLSRKPGNRDSSFAIVEEVAYALQRLSDGLDRRDAVEAAIGIGEVETAKHTQTEAHGLDDQVASGPDLTAEAPSNQDTSKAQLGQTQQTASILSSFKRQVNHQHSLQQTIYGKVGPADSVKPLALPRIPEDEPQVSTAPKRMSDNQKIAVVH